jgi:copper chaperone
MYIETRTSHSSGIGGSMKTEELKIEGMSCGHCVMSVKKELARLAGLRIDAAEVGKVRVEYDESRVTREDLARAIDEAGYRLVG